MIAMGCVRGDPIWSLRFVTLAEIRHVLTRGAQAGREAGLGSREDAVALRERAMPSAISKEGELREKRDALQAREEVAASDCL